MKKNLKSAVTLMMALLFICVVFTGCGNAAGTEADTGTENNTEIKADAKTLTDDTGTEVDTGIEADAKTSTDDTETVTKASTDTATNYEAADINIGSLKGPTSMGLVYLMDLADKGEAENNYTFTMAAAADELLPKLISGDLDIVLVPANVAGVLYNKTEGGISVIDINTLGVLYMVSGDDSIQSIKDLGGKTLYLTGKGTTPDYVLQYLLAENGLTTDDLTLEYKSEATEVAAILAENPDAIGLLPQPFVTAACMQNEALSIVLDMTEEWAAVQGEGGSSLVTGVTVVRNEFLQQNIEAVAKFMEEHKESTDYANENVEEAAALVAARGIVEKAPVAAKAMPYCNIVYIDSEDMKQALSGYLEVLYDADASSVGGSLPADDFYYIP